MDHLQQLLAELDELVRRVRHDEKFPEILQVGLDLFELSIHGNATSPGPSAYD
jgi:hypothetical protein